MSDQNNEKNDDWRNRELGALWKKEGRNQSFLSGKVNNKQVIVFENTKKKSDKAPDFVVYESKPMEGQGQSSQSSEPNNTEDDLL